MEKVNLLIELKPHGDNELLEIFHGNHRNIQRNLMPYSHFIPVLLKWFKKHHPEIIRGQITEYFKSDEKMKPLYEISHENFIFQSFY